VVNLLRQIEVAVANGKTTAQACKEAEIVEQTYFRWRKEYGGLQVDQAKRLKELEQENAKLKRLVAELSLDKLVLKDIASGNVWSAPFFANVEMLLTPGGLRECIRPLASRPLLATRP
jgi:transposase-like protein